MTDQLKALVEKWQKKTRDGYGTVWQYCADELAAVLAAQEKPTHYTRVDYERDRVERLIAEKAEGFSRAGEAGGCSQCGQPISALPCGPTHALMQHETRTGRAARPVLPMEE